MPGIQPRCQVPNVPGSKITPEPELLDQQIPKISSALAFQDHGKRFAFQMSLKGEQMRPVTALCQRRQGPGPRILAVVSHGQHGADSMRMAERLAFKARAMENTELTKRWTRTLVRERKRGEDGGCRGACDGRHRFLMKRKTKTLASSFS